MSVLVVGLNYRGVPLDLLERFAFDQASLPKGLRQLLDHEAVHEGVILSTCNRTEVYALVGGFHSGVAALRQFLGEFHHVAPEEFADRVYALYEEDAVRHLFGVASGIDSMVVGEPQILAQVREAFRVAGEESACGPVLSALFRQGIRVGRRARSETGIARSAATFAMAGATLAREALGELRGRTVLIVGAGKMSDLAARTLVREGVRVLVANRTAGRAEAVAVRIGGEAVSMADLGGALAHADAVLASTGSAEPVITRDMVAAAMEQRPDRRLVLLDLAVPRDVEPLAGTVDNVTLRDLDDLRDAVAPGAEQMRELERVRGIVAEEVPKFIAWQRAHHLAPLIAALQERADSVRIAELRRAAARLGDLTDEQRETIDKLTRALVSKLLHGPVTSVKRSAGSTDGEALARALRELFSLPEGE